MKTAKHQRSQQTRVVSPLAKYNDLNRLTCIVCRTIINTDSLWPDHIASASHKKKVELLRQKKRQREKEVEVASKKQRVEEPVNVPAPAPAPFASSEAEEKINFIEGDIPTDFFDDRGEQAKVTAVSTSQKVTQSGGYAHLSEREEEELALRELVMELEKKKEESGGEIAYREEEEDEDEVVGVVDLQYEPAHEPLSIAPHKVMKEVVKRPEVTTDTTTDTTPIKTAEQEKAEQQERELQAIEDEKKKNVQKLEALKSGATERPMRTLPGFASTLKRRAKKAEIEEENDNDAESWRSQGFGW